MGQFRGRVMVPAGPFWWLVPVVGGVLTVFPFRVSAGRGGLGRE